MALNPISTSNTFTEWLTLTNQLTLQQAFFESSINELNASANIANEIVITSTTGSDEYYLVSANVVTGNATNVYAYSEAYYNPANRTLYIPSAQFTGNSNILLPTGNTTQRPSNVSSGMIRYNTSKGDFEGYANGWDSIVLSKELGLANTGNLTYSTVPGDTDRILSMSERLLAGGYQNTTFTYDINNERIITEVVTVTGSNTKTTTYTYNSSNVLTGWATVES